MINFVLGAFFCGALLITFYFTLFSKKKINNYKEKDQLEKLISQKDFEFLLIDIQPEEDYRNAHIPNAVNIPFDKLVSSLPVENMFITIIVYGSNKKISEKASRFLSESGYFNVTSFGALSRWKGDLITNEFIGDKHIENTRKGRNNFPV